MPKLDLIPPHAALTRVHDAYGHPELMDRQQYSMLAEIRDLLQTVHWEAPHGVPVPIDVRPVKVVGTCGYGRWDDEA